MSYVPKRGDVIWIDLNPRVGHEQSGHRPALVISPTKFNSKTKLAICCPHHKPQKGALILKLFCPTIWASQA